MLKNLCFDFVTGDCKEKIIAGQPRVLNRMKISTFRVPLRKVRDRVRKFWVVEGYRVVKTIRGITNSKSPVRVVRFAKLRVLDFFFVFFCFILFKHFWRLFAKSAC